MSSRSSLATEEITRETTWKGRKVAPIQGSFYKADIEMLDMIVDYLGCSRSEALRSAVRIMATQLPLGRAQKPADELRLPPNS